MLGCCKQGRMMQMQGCKMLARRQVRWQICRLAEVHGFSEEEFNAYVQRLENEVYDYMKRCEAKAGANFTM